MIRNKCFVVIFLIITLLLPGCGSSDEQQTSMAGGEGGLAPDFSLKSLDGQSFTLSAFRGKNPVFLVFWATWCPYCIQEVPLLKELYAKLSPKGLKILSINIGYNDPLLRVQAFQKKFELPYPILYDANAMVSRQFGVVGVPFSVLVDRDGKIVYRSNRTPDNLEAFLAKEKPA
jgi:peroxiredoxin